MRYFGTQIRGLRLPIISRGDDLAEIVSEQLAEAVKAENLKLSENDIIGVTEAVVAKSQGNFATMDEIGADIRKKFPVPMTDGTIGLVFPILSRNRFVNILKGIARGAEKVYVLLQYPSDEVGNPIMDLETIDELSPLLTDLPILGSEFKRLTKNFLHPFTGMDYISLYESLSPNITVYVSNDPRDILKLTKNVLVGEIHARNRTKARLIKAGAERIYTLSDILCEPVGDSGFNPDYGVLGSNLATDETLKLFPRNCNEFVQTLRAKIKAKTGTALEVMIYGDGAFKDPACGIWELADPVVSPAYTERLGGRPDEIKIKYVSENVFGDLSSEEKTKAVTQLIKDKSVNGNNYNEGTTPRKYSDLLGSLCDLTSGSGDKGTPVVLIQGYFDDYSKE